MGTFRLSVLKPMAILCVLVTSTACGMMKFDTGTPFAGKSSNPAAGSNGGTVTGSGNPALDAQVSALFQARCVSCHGPGSSGLGNFGYINDVSMMVSRGLIVPGNPEFDFGYCHCE